jgi:hypothetical protein
VTGAVSTRTGGNAGRGASALPSRHDVPATWRAPALITRRASLLAGTPTHAPWPWPGQTGTISAMCCILIAPMAGCAAPELADLCAYGRRVMPN